MAATKPMQDEYELARKRLAQRSATQRQQSEQALKRQFSRQGGIGSGAYIKSLETSRQNIAEQEEAGNEAISAEQLRAQKAEAEIEKGRQFAAEQNALARRAQEAENLRGREFARQQLGEQQSFARGETEKARQYESGQQQLAREFAAAESRLGREFATGEQRLGREFTAGEAEKVRAFQQRLADMDQTFKNQQFEFQKALSEFDKESKLAALDLERKRFALEEDAQIFNKKMAQAEFDRPTDIVSSMFGEQYGLGESGLASQIPSVKIINSIAKWCYLAGTMIAMEDETFKPIEQIEIGDKLKSGSIVNFIGKAFAQESIYEIDGELCTGSHILLDKDDIAKEVRDIKRAKLINSDDDKIIVYPMDAEIGFFETKSGNISVSFSGIEGAINAEDELRILNEDEQFIKILKDQKKD